jgi:hypothetical protein
LAGIITETKGRTLAVIREAFPNEYAIRKQKYQGMMKKGKPVRIRIRKYKTSWALKVPWDRDERNDE